VTSSDVDQWSLMGYLGDKDINQTPLSVDINDPIYTLNVDILGIIDL